MDKDQILQMSRDESKLLARTALLYTMKKRRIRRCVFLFVIWIIPYLP